MKTINIFISIILMLSHCLVAAMNDERTGQNRKRKIDNLQQNISSEAEEEGEWEELFTEDLNKIDLLKEATLDIEFEELFDYKKPIKPQKTFINFDIIDGLDCYVLEDITSTVIGEIKFKRKSDSLGYISWMSVNLDFQGHGFGRQLLRHAIQKLRSYGCTEVGLHLMGGELNHAAYKLYTSEGFLMKEDKTMDPPNYFPYMVMKL